MDAARRERVYLHTTGGGGIGRRAARKGDGAEAKETSDCRELHFVLLFKRPPCLIDDPGPASDVTPVVRPACRLRMHRCRRILPLDPESVYTLHVKLILPRLQQPLARCRVTASARSGASQRSLQRTHLAESRE